MALSNYEELKDSIIKWSHRKDILTLIPDFILLAEKEFYSNSSNPLEMREQEKTSTATTNGTRFLEIPDGFLTQRDFKITVQDYQLDLKYTTPKGLIIKPYTGVPRWFTVTNEIEFDVLPDQDYEVTIKYFAEIPQLTEANPTNDILTIEPNIYLFGTLKQVFIWSEDDDQAAKYDGLFNDAIKGANKKYRKGRYGASPAMKLKGCTP